MPVLAPFVRSSSFPNDSIFHRSSGSGHLYISDPCCSAGGDRCSPPSDRHPATKRAASSPPSAIGPVAVDLVVPLLAGLAALAAHPQAGHCGSLASNCVCAL